MEEDVKNKSPLLLEYNPVHRKGMQKERKKGERN
jgi:hypothetical protein